jgi:enoyl-CoA hydratase/carnithine racemase
MTTGRRYGGAEALEAGIVDSAVAEDAVRSTAIGIAEPLAGKAGPTLGTIKSRMYAPALEALRADVRG